MTVMVLFFQNCSGTQFLKIPSANLAVSAVDVPFVGPIANASGNGGTYDGKLRILHNYVKDFKCEGRAQPESILIRKNATDWVIIKNTPSQCHVVDQAPVSGVIYDDVAKIANYDGKTYIAPKPYYVSATEDPNLPDVNLIDGVCEDMNAQCSLLAATQQAGMTAPTIPVSVEIPAGVYKLTAKLGVNYLYPTNPILFNGANKATTIIDAQNLTYHFQLSGGGPNTFFQNLSLINGNNSAAKQASSIYVTNYVVSSYSGSLTIDNCLFKNNINDSPIYIPVLVNGLIIRKSQFDSNSADGVNTEGNRITIEDSSFSNNGGDGLSANGAYSSVKVKNSTFNNNAGQGLNLGNCYDCIIENSTVYSNKGNGLTIFAGFPASNGNFNMVINNSTVYNNGTLAGGSIRVGFVDPINYLTINNSVVAVSDSAKSNCSPNGYSNQTIVATNSLFDDNTCAATGSGNITGNPQLGTFALNGGLTPTLVPSLTSPLIDAGDKLTCAAKDQRGLPRPAGAAAKCDIGAVEVQ